jgi:RNA polymerase sigma-70 factor (ECF subfamily)
VRFQVSFVKPGAPPRPSNSLVRTVPESAEAAAAEAEERSWVERASAGETAAFQMLVERHGDRAYALALRMLGSPSDAEEVAQDAFVRAWRALPRFRGDSSFGTWLHRIVVRRALDRSVVLKARRARETSLEAADEVPHGTTGEGKGSELSRKLDGLLGSLSDLQRAAVVMYYYEDRSVDEVGRALGIPVGTVKTHLHRARGILRAGWLDMEAS